MQDTYQKKLQRAIAEYRRDVNPNGEISSREIASWLFRTGRAAAPERDQVEILTKDVSKAMRTDFIEDPKGRRVRRNHSVKKKVKDNDGVERYFTFWHDITIAPPPFMQASFAQRRDAVADDCWQLKQDVDSYNEFFNKAAPIQMEWDFSEDMEEREYSLDYMKEEEAA